MNGTCGCGRKPRLARSSKSVIVVHCSHSPWRARADTWRGCPPPRAQVNWGAAVGAVATAVPGAKLSQVPHLAWVPGVYEYLGW